MTGSIKIYEKCREQEQCVKCPYSGEHIYICTIKYKAYCWSAESIRKMLKHDNINVIDMTLVREV